MKERQRHGGKGRKKHCGLLGKPWKSLARLTRIYPLLTWSFERTSKINSVLDSFAKEKTGTGEGVGGGNGERWWGMGVVSKMVRT